MPITKPSTPFDVDVAANPEETAIDVEVKDPLEVEGEDELTFDFSGEEGKGSGAGDIPFDANLVEHMDESACQTLAVELMADYENDYNSRADWEKVYKDGLDLLGLKIEERTDPWQGACGVFHPLISEATVKYQAEAMTETFPASGPVKTQVIGKLNPQKEMQAMRVRDDMNFWLTEKIKDYRSEHERMLWAQSLCGSAFKKIYADPVSGMPRAMFVPAEDFVVAYGCSDLWSANRFTHVMRKTKNDIRKLQVAGFYCDCDLGEPVNPQSALQQKKDKVANERKIQVFDDRYVLLEMHVDLDLPGFEDPDGIERPYVVTINKANGNILSIYRNWEEKDQNKTRRQHFVHYPFVPGFGFYGYGWVHLLGNSAKAATMITRQVVDAGTLSNLPGGLKARGLRIKSSDEPIAPGEWRDVDIPGGKIQDNVMALPYKEPSQTLYNMLMLIVDEGRRLAGITDMKIADFNKETPVGTTLAILERTLKVMNAIQARVHASMREEFQILKDIIKNYTPPQYEYEVDGGEPNVKPQDYDAVAILPVSDPNATTMAQRIVQYQAALQLATQAPDLYNRPEIHRDMLTILGVRNIEKILPLQDEMQPMDPVSENMAILTGKPVKTFMDQDHEAHIQTHMALAQDPKVLAMVGQSPQAAAIHGAFAAHVTEHVAYAYRTNLERELGTPLPKPGEPIPPEVEATLSQLTAAAAAKLLRKDMAEMQAQRIVQTMQDPMIQLQNRELDIKEKDVENKKEESIRNYTLEQVKSLLDLITKTGQADLQQLLAGLQHGVQLAQSAQDRSHERAEAEAARDHEEEQARAQREHEQQLARQAAAKQTQGGSE